MVSYAIVKKILDDTTTRILVGSSLFLNGALWLLLLWKVIPVDGEVILHYTVYFGIDRVGPSEYVLLYPALGLLILIANFFFGAWLHAKHEFLVYIVNGLSAFINLLLCVVGIVIILANV